MGTYYGTYDTYNEAVQKRNQLIENGWNKDLIQYQRGQNNPDRYICENSSGNYRIQKVVNGEIIHFGVCNSIEEARSERDFWESINWDFDLLDLY